MYATVGLSASWLYACTHCRVLTRNCLECMVQCACTYSPHMQQPLLRYTHASADVEVGSRQSTQDVVWGPLVFEARRFVELRKKSLWQQFKSSESFGMGFFYTLNVRCPCVLEMPCVVSCSACVQKAIFTNTFVRSACSIHRVLTVSRSFFVCCCIVNIDNYMSHSAP